MTHSTILGWPYPTRRPPQWPFAGNRNHWQWKDLELWVAGGAPFTDDIVLDLAKNNHGTSFDCTRRATPVGSGIEFVPASTSGIDLPAKTYLDTTLPFTITWCVHQDALTEEWPALCSLQTSAGIPYEIFWTDTGAYAEFVMGSNSASWINMDAAYPAGVSRVGDVHWGCFTFNGVNATNGANFALYLNGKAVTLNSTGALGSITNQNGLGYLGGFATADFDGVLLDFRVYSREFSARQAWALYQQPWALYQGARSQTVARWVGPSAAGGSFSKTAADSLVLTDTSSETASLGVTAADSLVFTDVSAETADFVLSIAESLVFTDTAAGSVGGIAKTASDVLVLTDTSAETAAFARAALDAIAYSDSAEIATKVIGALVADTLVFTDAASAEGGVAQAVQRSGSSLTQRQMKRLERLQLIQRDDDEVINLIMGIFK